MLAKAKAFLSEGVWKIQTARLPKRESFFIRALRIFLLSFREFATDQCYLRSSALTFYSLLSIVPVFAMALGIAKGFGVEQALKENILDFAQQETVMTQILEFSRNLLQNTQGGVVAGVGMLFLIWSVLKVLGHIEKAFNHIWGVKESRPWTRKFSDYLSLAFVCPILLILASSITVFVTARIDTFAEQQQWLTFVGPTLVFLISFLPYTLLWLLLTFLYIFMPNTNVKASAALLGGVLAGTLYQLLQWAYIHFQVGVTQFSAIYGSFAAFPLFLIWLQLSWLIVLYGGELSFACQNELTYELEPECRSSTQRLKKITAAVIMSHCVQKFQEFREPPSAGDLARELELPIRLVNEVTDLLVQSRMLSRVHESGSGEEGYWPARPLESLTLADVLDALDRTGTEAQAVLENPHIEIFREKIEGLWELVKKNPQNFLLKEGFEDQEDRAHHFEKKIMRPA